MSSEYVKKDDILKFIEDIKCNDNVPKNYGTVLDIMLYIRSMAAYDVDKVIQQLEELISFHESYVEALTKEIEGKRESEVMPEICSLHNNRGYLDGLKRALEIVKSGGIAVGQKGERE